MSDFLVEILENNNLLDVESSSTNYLETNNDINSIIEYYNNETIINLEIEQIMATTLQINTEYVGNVVFAGDVIGLDAFIGNFIDNYEIDCGTP